MLRANITFVTALVAVMASEASPQNAAESVGAGSAASIWALEVGLASATLAAQGAELLASDGLSWPDGRQATVTYWRPAQGVNLIVRCIDYFDDSMRSTGGGCQKPRPAQ